MPVLLKSKALRAAAIVALLVGLYALLGFKVAPGIARDQAQAFVREHYGRELSVGTIAIHPFKLQVEVGELSLPDADGRPMLGFERLFVDFELSSLWHRAYTFAEVTVAAPLLRAVVRPDGSLNLADLALPDEEPGEPPPPVWIWHLGVERGRIEFTDEARRTPLTRQFQSVGFELENFRTTPEGGDFSFRAQSPQQEIFEWSGSFALAPVISSQGQFRVEALRAPGMLDFLGDARPFTASRGTIGLHGTYRASLGEVVTVEVDLPTIEIGTLDLRARGVDADWVRIPSVLVSGTRVELPAQTVAVEALAVTGLEVDAWLDPDGSLNLERLFMSEPVADSQGPVAPAEPVDAASSAPGDASAPSSAQTSPASDPPWTLSLGTLELKDASVTFEDRTLAPTGRFDVAPVNLRVTGASLDLSRPLPVELHATINGHASFEAAGTITPQPLAAELEVGLAKARMQTLQPYVLPLADLTIAGGELNVEGKATLAPPESEGPELAFAGNVSIAGFRSKDNALEQEFVSFDRLELSKVAYAMAPDALSIDRVVVRKPYARVIISEEQVVNLAAVLDPKGSAEALAQRRAEAAAEAARSPAERRRLEKEREAAEKAAERARHEGTAPPPRQAPAHADAFPVRVREIRLVDGRMDFSDNFVQPNFSADVQQLNGSITGASSAWDARAKVKLEGRLDEFSPVSIEGELQPFAFDHYTDLGMRFENISLPILNPYSTPLAGYSIAKGKLTTVLHYTIVDRALEADHKIRIDQLEWGEATATQGEATLPVKFATSLLKDRNGVIDLDVPVDGTLDDPTFRIGPIVWQIIKNIIVKAVTAPFSLLGSLFAGAEEAQFIDFAPGDATVDAATAERLTALAKSLGEKPDLQLDVPIGAVAEIDRPALAERAYLAALDEAMQVEFAKQVQKGRPLPAYPELEAQQKVDVLTLLIQQLTGAAPQVPEPPEPPDGTSRAEARALRQAATVEYLEAAARAGVVVADVALERLAQERAAAIQRALLAGGTLESTRVFPVRDGKVSTHEGQVRFELGLQ